MISNKNINLEILYKKNEIENLRKEKENELLNELNDTKLKVQTAKKVK